jgi:hypothetical protein
VSTAPGFYVQTVNVEQDYDVLLATDQRFMVGLTERGPVTPQRHSTLEAWEATYGDDVAYSQMRQSAEMYFQEGGRNLITQRVTGDSPVKASLMLQNDDDPAVDVIKLQAAEYGVIYNSWTATVAAGDTGVIITIKDEDGKTVYTSGDLTTQAEIVDYFDGKKITATAQAGTGLPVVAAATALTGGTDDHAAADDDNYQAALDKLDMRFGPGQVDMPGRTTDEAHAQVRAHCAQDAYDRIPLWDLADTSDAATLVSGITDDIDADGSEKVGAIAPWVVSPDGTQLPPAGYAAAKMAVVDLSTGNPNQPAAGARGQARWITGLTQDFTDADRATLNDAGINVIHDVDLQGTLQLYGYRTLSTDPLSVGLNNARLDMRIRWHARKLARPLLFEGIDGFGILAGRYGASLQAMLDGYKELGAIYGYLIDVTSVNTPETAASRQLNAKIGVQRSPFAERVWLTVKNYQVDANLAEVVF